MEHHSTTTAGITTAQERFADLLQRHRKIVFKVSRTYCFQADDRADLEQDIVAQLWRAFPGFDPTRSFSTWMYRIALNVAISQVRSSSLRGNHLVPLDDTLHDIADEHAFDAEAEQRAHALHRFIATLDRINRALLLLYLEQHSYRDIADILGLGESNVATRINRLKLRIRDHIAHDHHD